MTRIEWTQKTWNPIVGCSIVSPGCTNCYAMKMAARLEAMCVASGAAYEADHGRFKSGSSGLLHYRGLTQPSKAGSVWTGKVTLAPESIIRAPLSRRQPTMYFVNSMSDLFHEDVPDEWIDRVFAIMAMCPQHTFQVLTKRSERMRVYMNTWTVSDIFKRQRLIIQHKSAGALTWKWPLPNVWLGVSTERQQEADERVPDLLATPAAVRFVSAEPLLGPVDFERILFVREIYESGAHHYVDVLRGGFWSPKEHSFRSSQDGEPKNHFTNHSDIKDQLLNWVIVGGESGHGARPMHPDWARAIRDQCQAANVPFFFKQWGEFVSVSEVAGPGAHFSFEDGATVRRTGKKLAGRLLDGVEHNHMPERTR